MCGLSSSFLLLTLLLNRIAIGPIEGTSIVQYSHWRWCFYAISIADAVVQVWATFFLQETHTRKMLHTKVQIFARKQQQAPPD